MTLLSIVVPCYNEQETVSLFYDATSKVVDKMDMDYEIIFVNDGSKDKTLEECVKLYKKHPDHVRVIDFSRNFGKEGGLLAGLEYAKGDYITVMDADLQDPPEYLPLMMESINNENYDIVSAMTDKKFLRFIKIPLLFWVYTRLYNYLFKKKRLHGKMRKILK